MGQTIAFDTHAYVKKLKAVGFTEEQAETLASTQAELIDERLATKHGLKELEKTALRRDMKEMETNLKRDIKEMEMRLKHDLTVRLGGMIGVSVAVIVALVKLL